MATNDPNVQEELKTGGGYINPIMDDDVSEKEYGKIHAEISDPTATIDEPDFDTPIIDLNDGDDEDSPSLKHIQNPQTADLSKKDKTLAAETLADTVLDVYELLHIPAQKFVSISESDVQEMAERGEIGIDMEIPIVTDPNDPSSIQNLPLLDYIRTSNQQSAEMLTVSEEFKNKVKPPMVREFAKRGWGMTDLQVIGYEFAKDAGIKIAMMASLKRQQTQILEMLKTIHQGVVNSQADEHRMAEEMRKRAEDEMRAAEERGRKEAEREAARQAKKERDQQRRQETQKNGTEPEQPKKRGRRTTKMEDLVEDVKFTEIRENEEK